MKRKIYIGCITVVAGLVFLHDQYRNKAENMQNKSGMRFAKNTQKEVLNTTSITKLNSTVLSSELNTRTDTSEPEHRLIDRLSESTGRDLIISIKLFWQGCQTSYDCDQQLQTMKNQIPINRWKLLTHYSDKNQAWQQQMGNLVFDKGQPLSSRVTELKDKAREVWGNTANLLFADEFAVYDFSLQAEELRSASAQEYLKMFKNLMQNWKEEKQILGLVSPQAKYEQAVSLISPQITPIERKKLIQSLQATYLNKKQISQVRWRKQQISDQKRNIKEYQYQLEMLKHNLNQEYLNQPNLDKQDWDTYYQQQIEDFRRSFFQI